MKRSVQLVLITICSLLILAPAWAADTVADGVVGYVQGAVASWDANYKYPVAALGGINGDTGYGAPHPFNPPFQVSDIVVVGQGGNLTLHLSNPVPTNGRNLGVFANVGYVDWSDDGSGLTDGGPTTFMDPPQAVVSVSQDGITWAQLNGGLPIRFGLPTNYYTDTPVFTDPGLWLFDYQSEGNQVAHQSKPFLGTASDLANKTYAQIKTTLNNSCGGNWLDLSGVGLPAVNYVRFDVPAGAGKMVVDAIGAVGAAAPIAPGGRIVSESVGTGANTSHIVVDFGPQSYQFDVHYDGNLTGFGALQMLAANTDFALSSVPHVAYGAFITGLDYGGYALTGDGFPGTPYWAYYVGDGNTWTYSIKGASTHALSNGSYDGWIWEMNLGPGVAGAVPDFPVAPGTECAALSGNWSDGNSWRSGGPVAGAVTDLSNGGTVQIDQGGLTGGILTVGSSAGQSGAVHMLAGGALESDRVYLGYGGSGDFVQSGGGHRVDGNLQMGLLAGARGTYQLSDGNLWVAGSVYVGCDGNGAFTQSGGRNTIGVRMYVGQNSDGGAFAQNGSKNTVGVLTNVGQGPDGNGTYVLSGGQLIVPRISVGPAGTLELSGGLLTGNTADPNLLTGVDNVGLVHITSGTYWLAYVECPDPGNVLGTLEVDAGATLHVGKILVDHLIEDGTVILDTSLADDAAPPQSIGDAGVVPEPASLALLAMGALALPRRRRARWNR